jgi:hypothetical protein
MPRSAFLKYPAAIALSCAALAGCSTQLHVNQSASGGASATTASSAVTGSVRASSGQVAFSSGSRAASGATGGQVSLGRGGSAVLVLGLVIVDAVSQFASWLSAPGKAANELPASISHTCSCYGDKP